MKHKNLVILSTSYWNSKLKFRRHHFASLASVDRHKVLYVNPTFTILSFFEDDDARACYWDFLKGVKELSATLAIYTLPPLFPFQRRFPIVDLVNRKIAMVLVERAIRKYFGAELVVEIVYVPEDFFRIQPSSNTTLVYDCVDDHAEYPWNAKRKRQVRRTEERLFRTVDLVTVSSISLLARAKQFNPNVASVPNGVNVEVFSKALDVEHGDLPIELRGLSGPIILYVGAIAEWFDEELMVDLCRSNKGWNIVLIGPRSVPLDTLRTCENLMLIAPRPQELLPSYLRAADVCIIPFLVNDLTKAVNPLKVYEYLAAGKPVVSTALPDVMNLKADKVVHVALDHPEFISQIEYCIEHKRDNVDKRIGLASKFSWESIYRSFMEAIEGCEERRANRN